MEVDGDDFFERRPEDIDKSAAELVQDGDLELDEDAFEQVPAQISVTNEGDELVATVGMGTKGHAISGFVIVLILGVAAEFGGTLADERPAFLMWVWLLLGPFILVTGWTVVSRSRVRMSPSGVRNSKVYSRGGNAGQILQQRRHRNRSALEEDSIFAGGSLDFHGGHFYRGR